MKDDFFSSIYYYLFFYCNVYTMKVAFFFLSYRWFFSSIFFFRRERENDIASFISTRRKYNICEIAVWCRPRWLWRSRVDEWIVERMLAANSYNIILFTIDVARRSRWLIITIIILYYYCYRMKYVQDNIVVLRDGRRLRGGGFFIIGVIISVGKIQKKCYYYYLSRPTNSAENGGAAASRRNIATDTYIHLIPIYTHICIYICRLINYNRYIIPTFSYQCIIAATRLQYIIIINNNYAIIYRLKRIS